jgi:hypothetical protein
VRRAQLGIQAEEIMRNFSTAHARTILALGFALLLALCCYTAIARAHARSQSDAPQTTTNPAVPPGARIDPSHVTYKWPSQILWQGLVVPPRIANWRGGPDTPQSALLVGDPSKPGLYIQLIKWFPHQTSRPHFHNMDRFVTVLSGTWWVGTTTDFQPDTMVPMPAGSFVTDLAGRVHYDGAKDGPVTIEIVGQGPVTTTPAETK